MATYSIGRPDRVVGGGGRRWYVFARPAPADGKAVAGPFPTRRAAVAAALEPTRPAVSR